MSENDTFGYTKNSTNYDILNEKHDGQQETKEISTKLIDEINEKCNFIKYSTYRTATKLVELKKRLFTHHIPYQTVKGIFLQHKLNHNDNVPTINRENLTAIVHDIFYAADKMSCYVNCKDFFLEIAIKTFVNFIFLIFNRNNELISSLELRQTFLILCRIDTQEQIIFEHFTLCSDHNCSVTKYRFEAMITTWSKLFGYIDNSAHFQLTNVPDLLTESFIHCPGIVGLNEYQFNSLWQLQSQSPTLFQHYSNVILLMKRLIDSEKIIHDIECVSCRKCSYEGLRFQCQQCSKISLCFMCFCMGYTTKKHEPTHRMYEINSNEILRNRFMSFLTKLCNFFSKTSSDCRTILSPNIVYDQQSIEIDDCNLADNSASKDSLGWLAKSPPNKKLLHQTDLNEISEIIKILIDERVTLADLLRNECSSKGKFEETLKKHENILSNVITQLGSIVQKQSSSIQLTYSSTPLRPVAVNGEKFNFGNSLTRSIAGADIHKTYLENNRSDLSISDVSSWLHTRKHQTFDRNNKMELLPTVAEQSSNIETEMCKFKDLLNVVKDIIEGMLDDDSCSDNIEMSKATTELENVLDNIIGAAERKRL